MPRWILVDDTDPGIQYNGPWFVDRGSQDTLGNFGIPYLNTLHGIDTSGSFSYSFRGSRVLITATLEFAAADDGPSWQCIVDGIAIPSIVYTTPENRLRYCEEDGLAEDAQHNITVKAFVSNQRTFWFDYVQYLPPVDAPLENAAISVDIPDPQMNFGTGWKLHTPGYITSQTGSTFSFNFIGTSLTWFGFYDNSLPLTPATAAFSVDGAKPIAFGLNGAAAQRTGVQYNQIFFQTPSLPIGEHTLNVVYDGNSLTAPLSVSVVYIENGTSSLSSPLSPMPSAVNTTVSGTPFTIVPSISQPSVTVNPEPNALSSSGTSLKGQIGGIIGAILGGIAIISLLMVGLSQRYKRWRRARNRLQMTEVRPTSSTTKSLVLPINSSATHLPLVPDTAVSLQEEGNSQLSSPKEQASSPDPEEISEIPRNPGPSQSTA